MKVYFISGLAADQSVFRHIRLPEGCEAVHLEWIQPLPGETLAGYALRLAQRIDPSEPFALVGLSMGGMLAVEIAKKHQPLSTILISSIPCMQHLPGYLRLAGVLRLHRIVPIGLIRHLAVLKRLFTTEAPEDKNILRSMIRRSDARFIRWAMHAILTWENREIPGRLVQIHGSRDEILPRRYTRPTHLVAQGGHLMVMSRPAEINRILGEVLSNTVTV